MAHIRQSRPDSGLGFQVKVLKTFDRFRVVQDLTRGEYDSSRNRLIVVNHRVYLVYEGKLFPLRSDVPASARGCAALDSIRYALVSGSVSPPCSRYITCSGRRLLSCARFIKMCSGSEAGSYLRLIDVVSHSTLGLRV